MTGLIANTAFAIFFLIFKKFESMPFENVSYYCQVKILISKPKKFKDHVLLQKIELHIHQLDYWNFLTWKSVEKLLI